MSKQSGNHCILECHFSHVRNPIHMFRFTAFAFRTKITSPEILTWTTKCPKFQTLSFHMSIPHSLHSNTSHSSPHPLPIPLNDPPPRLTQLLPLSQTAHTPRHVPHIH